MPHELDITDGVASFAAARTPGWHRLGTVIPDGMTLDEALDLAHLRNWNVRKMPLQVPIFDETGVGSLEVNDRFATVRTNPINGKVEYLGVVGSRFTPIQNEATVGILQALVDESGAQAETAGALLGGRETFVSMKLPEAMKIELPDGGSDSTELYIAALNYHDGSGAMRLLVTPIRPVCKNTTTLALATARSSFSIPHDGSAEALIAEARRALGLTFKYVAEFEKTMYRLLDISMDQETATDIVFKQVFKYDPEADISPRTLKARAAHVESCVELLSSPTNAAGQGTAYAAINAVTEHVDWMWKARGADDQGAAKAMRMLNPDYVEVKSSALRHALAYAG
jgi:phage/plasmid-like protein (TIGR03299 family)